MPEDFPTWAAEEVTNAKWRIHDTWRHSGYILDIYPNERKVDVQFYEKLPEGRYIAPLDIPRELSIEDLRIGEPYVFEFKVFKASLSRKLVDLLAERYSVTFEDLYRYELIRAEHML